MARLRARWRRPLRIWIDRPGAAMASEHCTRTPRSRVLTRARRQGHRASPASRTAASKRTSAWSSARSGRWPLARSDRWPLAPLGLASPPDSQPERTRRSLRDCLELASSARRSSRPLTRICAVWNVLVMRGGRDSTHSPCGSYSTQAETVTSAGHARSPRSAPYRSMSLRRSASISSSARSAASGSSSLLLAHPRSLLRVPASGMAGFGLVLELSSSCASCSRAMRPMWSDSRLKSSRVPPSTSVTWAPAQGSLSYPPQTPIGSISRDTLVSAVADAR